ncbi:MAG: hypothetical protein RLZZ589_1978 [Cyanobacteriota bacterium]
MCFSATASFVTAAALTPIGVAGVAMARRRDPDRWLPLALLPLLFASPQALEGVVWLGLTAQEPWPGLRLAALARPAPGGPGLPHLCLGCLARLDPVERPAPVHRPGHSLAAAAVAPIVHHGSINYQMQLSWADRLGHQPIRVIYALIICLPLLCHPNRRLCWLAFSLALGFAVAQLAFLYAFSSVWCYFSAVISVLVLWVLQGEAPSSEQPSPNRLSRP